ncbi:MAG: hypothetical protein KDB82_08720, partial [Planctomycetes bacterium]|nr:hypothetical protein [Planctomycetota bacterium]
MGKAKISLIEKVATALHLIPKLGDEGTPERMQPGVNTNPFPLSSYPPVEKWDDWEELDPAAWPVLKKRKYSIVPTTCFNCESACGLLAYVDKE